MTDYFPILGWVFMAIAAVLGLSFFLDIFTWMPRTGPDCECEGKHTKLKVYGCECWCCKEHWSTLDVETKWYK